MSKLNINELIQQKLQGLDFKHQPEFWDKMEQKIESNAPAQVTTAASTGSSLSTIYIISGITTAVAVLTAIAFIIFGNNNGDIPNLENDTVSIENTTNTNSSTPYNERKSTIAFDPCEENEDYVISSEDNSSETTNKIKPVKKTAPKSDIPIVVTQSDIEESILEESNLENTESIDIDNQDTGNDNEPILVDEDTQITEENVPIVVDDQVIENKQPIVTEPVTFESDSSDNNYQRRDPNTNPEGPKNPEVKEEKKPNNNLKKVTPINKPAKRVFKKRRGILRRLGLRK